ncbi:glycosyltransferase family 2 protein [Mangrovactinospora gilvigrisea]|uniref:glycosyltransferase family 2 protein n=1 Tax=Mangrovactinospora gilvigrisea TaxID=1428644 RepID=UPI0008FC3889|nr:glycosyltransferase [Mangrovactinospora gilvigrisea]
MSSIPSISVAVISHNYGRFIGEALRSAVNQLSGDYNLEEVAVFDDASTDDTAAVVSKFPEVKFLPGEHAGFGPTLTRAIRECSGEWVALLDADDYWELDRFRQVAPLLSSDVGLVTNSKWMFNNSTGLESKRIYVGGSTSTIIVRRSFALDMLPATNEIFFLAFEKLGLSVALDEPLTYYRIHDSNMTDRKTPGAFRRYFSEVSMDVSLRLSELAQYPPAWASRSTLEGAAARYKRNSVAYREMAEEQERENVLDEIF